MQVHALSSPAKHSAGTTRVGPKQAEWRRHCGREELQRGCNWAATAGAATAKVSAAAAKEVRCF